MNPPIHPNFIPANWKCTRNNFEIQWKYNGKSKIISTSQIEIEPLRNTMTTASVSLYHTPQQWMLYNVSEVAMLLVEAKTSAAVLNRLPYLYRWIEQVHEEQLRLEAVGTTRIEGAQFTPREQDDILDSTFTPSTGLTHSQRQLRAANETYRWLRTVDPNRPINAEFILEIQRRIVTGCDDDHCEPGKLRRQDDNVTFGYPVCRGAEGGDELSQAFSSLIMAINREFRNHDPIIQAFAVHYHIGAMHPFGDGNGRTARALEAFMMRRAGVNDMVMVSLSNYYYEHRDQYRAALHAARLGGHDLTPFLKFALPAIVNRCDSLANEITVHSKRILYREMARSLFGRLRTPRRRALPERQLQIIECLLDYGPLRPSDLAPQIVRHYMNLKFPERALERDLNALFVIDAIKVMNADDINNVSLDVNLDWPQQFSESELLQRYENMPSAASTNYPAASDLTRLLGHGSLRRGI